MSEKIWNDIEVDFLNKIYNYKGAVGVDDLFHMLKSNYGLWCYDGLLSHVPHKRVS